MRGGPPPRGLSFTGTGRLRWCCMRSPRASQTSRCAVSERSVLLAQGAYYVASGLWAVLNRRGFEAVTGPKRDYWLVRTVGLLAATIGASLLAGTRREPTAETALLGLAAGASFTAVDLVYVARRRVRPVYLVTQPCMGSSPSWRCRITAAAQPAPDSPSSSSSTRRSLVPDPQTETGCVAVPRAGNQAVR